MSTIIAFDRTRPYNNLPLLPPPEEKVMTIEILKALNKANKALAELKGLATKLPNQSMLINTIAIREAKASTAIENIFTTDDKLYKALSLNESSLEPGTKEVLHYRKALWAGYNTVKNKKKLDVDIMIKLYREINSYATGYVRLRLIL